MAPRELLLVLFDDGSESKDDLAFWPSTRQVLLCWMVNGWARIEREGVVMDVVSVEQAGFKDMAGVTVVVTHPGLAEQFCRRLAADPE